MHLMKLLGDVGQLEARFVNLEIVLILASDRCTVCPESTTGTEIFLAAPDGPPR
jgi:hypothetical protein